MNCTKSKAISLLLNSTSINPKKDMSPRDIHGLLIGSWQCNHNFARQFTLIDPRKRPRFFWWTVRWFSVLFSTILWDLQYLYKKSKLK